jgi:hypothetical protein
MKTLSRREFLVTAGIAAGGTILAACAPSAAPTEEMVEPAEVPEPTTAPEPTVQVFDELEPPPEAPAFDGGPAWEPQNLSDQEMVLWGLEYDPHIERYGILAETFTKRTGAAVEVQPQGWPIDDKVMTAMAAGAPPDVICWMGFVSEPIIRQEGILPIDELIFDPLGLDSGKYWFPSAIGAYEFEGRPYGVPVENEWDGYTVTGRLDLIEAAGAEAAELWPASEGEAGFQFTSYDQLYALAEMLQQTDEDGNVTIWGLNSTGWEMWSFLSIIRSLGVDWWEPENKKFNLDSEAAVEGLRLLVEIPFERGIEGVIGMDHVDGFVAGQIACARGNGTTAGEAWKLEVPGENVIAPPPEEGGDSLWIGSGGWGFELTSQAANLDVGVEFMKFMCTYEAQYIFSQIYGASPPATRALIGSDIYAGDHPVKVGLRRQLKALDNFVFWGFGFPFNAVSAAVGEAITSLREGKITSEEAAVQMQAGAIEAYEVYEAEL